ncbi:ABC-type nitrate/sulfonate/bicarbonate transport system ATPase subunit [Bradyrhizobium sp. LM4.3]
MLALERVSKTYPNGVQALARFSAEIKQGEIVAIIGGSGCGKSTLLRAIAGLDRTSSGTVTLDSEAIASPHAKIGIIFQEPRLLPWLSVADNIGFGLADLPATERREKVARALERVGLADKAQAWPRELSGGQAQRVAIGTRAGASARGALARRAVLGARRLHPQGSPGSSARSLGRYAADAHPRHA